MLSAILLKTGLSSLSLSSLMFVTQILNVDFISKTRRKKYFLISNKSKETRSEMEQKFIDKTWFVYYMTKVRNISFKIGIVLFTMAIILEYITKTWSEI